jgi:hypothetical protein
VKIEIMMNSWILPRSKDGVTINRCSADANPAFGSITTLATHPETTNKPAAPTAMSENKKISSVTEPLGNPVGKTPDVNDILCGKSVILVQVIW